MNFVDFELGAELYTVAAVDIVTEYRIVIEAENDLDSCFEVEMPVVICTKAGLEHKAGVVDKAVAVAVAEVGPTEQRSC